MTGYLLVLLLLAATYLLTLASLDPLDVATALVVSAVVLVGMRRFAFPGGSVPGGELARRLARFPLFCAAVVWEIVVGTGQVAAVVVGLRPLRRPGIVAVPIGERSPNGVAATALAITLSPGEVFVDVDWEAGVMLIHVLDAGDPDAIRERYGHFYERFQRQVFP